MRDYIFYIVKLFFIQVKFRQINRYVVSGLSLNVRPSKDASESANQFISRAFIKHNLVILCVSVLCTKFNHRRLPNATSTQFYSQGMDQTVVWF